MDAFPLFPATAVVNTDGSAFTGSLNKPYVMLYFSAHWCPPCRKFTPVLSEWYTKHKHLDMELVFISSDRDEAAFKEYSSQMTFPALNFSERALKQTLSEKFKVEGIPTLVVVDGKTGELVTDSGREGVSENPEGFPWKPKTLKEVLLGGPLLQCGGGPVADPAAALAGKVVGLYFGASWCGPCQGFVGTLKSAYEACKGAGKAFEVVYMPLDRDAESFKAYSDKMPWLAVPWEETQARTIPLAKTFGVGGIPHLVLLHADTLVPLNKDARADIDGTAEGYPWAPKLVKVLAPPTASTINEVPTLLVFGPPAQAKAIADAMLPVAQKLQASVRPGEDAPVQFMFADNSSPITGMIRGFLGLGGGGHAHSHSHDHNHDHSGDGHTHSHDHSHDHGAACADEPVDETVSVMLVSVPHGIKFVLGNDLSALGAHVDGFLARTLPGAEPLRGEDGDEEEDEVEAPSITAAAEQGLCSYTVTGEDHTVQRWYWCTTCGLDDSLGCCHACITKCHAGHTVVEKGVIRAYCDCGAGAKGACKALKK